ncbi:MAG TPA: cardiolipin synthase [Firmicutes bacterium]|nr:cardiolipin synthase [Bacillota bacterium]
MFYKAIRLIFSQRVLVSILIVLQLVLLFLFVTTSIKYYDIIRVILSLVSILVVFFIFNKKDKPAYKLSWVFLILVFPIFGGLFYLLFYFQSTTRKAKRQMEGIVRETQPLLAPREDVLPQITQESRECLRQVRYLQEYAGFPVYRHTMTEYLTPGEVKFEVLLRELKKARRYIFLEYFIVEEGLMWNSILDILKEKAKAGVEVRFMYDDMGCLLRLPQHYPRVLAEYGIKCVAFNKFRPALSTLQNNRDHRKIAVIDGEVAFTGGVNLADEYINAVERFGHWKDAAVMLKGEAAWSMTLMFLQMWAMTTNAKEDYAQFRPWQNEDCPVSSDGWVLPYADSPIDNEHVSEHVYMEIITGAKDYLYINSPYLIIDDTMLSALALAAKAGVDVRIVTPHHWDKKFVHVTTRSYYRDLIKAGVKIYEYSIGFIHSKTFVSDDKVATVGTANLDFRSLYLHFECGVWMYKTRAVQQVKEDFLKTLEKCHRITLEDCRGNAFLRLVQDVLRVFAPFM